MGLSMQGLGQTNSQYIANANLQVTKMEKDKAKIIKTTVAVGLSTVSLKENNLNANKIIDEVKEKIHNIYAQKGHQ